MKTLDCVNLGGWWRRRALPSVDWRLDRLLKWSVSRFVPDELVTWALLSLRPLLREIRQRRVELLYSTYSPISNHLLASWLKCLTGLPWVSDYRDLWIDDCHYRPRGRCRGAVERRMQRRLLAAADAVVAVTDGQADVLARYVPSERRKFHTIHNGVDKEDFHRIDHQAVRARLHGPKNRFLVTYAGSFISSRVDGAVVEGLRRFARWADGQSGQFELRVVGSISRDLRNRLGGAGVPLAVKAYLPHRDAIEQMIGADVLLLLTPAGENDATYMTGKVFEYLASGRPILAVGPVDGVAQRLVVEHHAGLVAAAVAGDILESLQRLWRNWKAGRAIAGGTLERMAPYTRLHLTGKLAHILNGLRR